MAKATDTILEEELLPLPPPDKGNSIDDLLLQQLADKASADSPTSPSDFEGLEMPDETFKRYLSTKGSHALLSRSAKQLRSLSMQRDAEFSIIAHIADDKLCELVASGTPIPIVCSQLRVSLWVLMHHIASVEGLPERLAVAEKMCAESLIGKSFSYLEDAIHSESMEMINATKNYAEFARWYAGAKNPTRFGTANERFNPSNAGPAVAISVNITREQAARSSATVVDGSYQVVEEKAKETPTIEFNTSDYVHEEGDDNG